MSVVHNSDAGKGLYFTEISGGEWATSINYNHQWYMKNVFVGATRNWSKNVLMWYLALDENHGPTNNGCQDCRDVVTINSINGSVTRNVEYYAIGHFSQFLRPGAFRITSANLDDATQLDHVAFITADGSNVLTIANASQKGKSFTTKL